MAINLDPSTAFRRRLPLPPLLRQLIAADRWVHPGDDVISKVVPFIRDPLVFLRNYEMMIFESGPLMVPEADEDDRFSEYRGSAVSSRELPWIDVEKVLFIVINRIPGDDVGIALDYRTGLDSPRVVGGNWHSKSKSGLVYCEVASTFPDFVGMLGLSLD